MRHSARRRNERSTALALKIGVPIFLGRMADVVSWFTHGVLYDTRVHMKVSFLLFCSKQRNYRITIQTSLKIFNYILSVVAVG